MTSRELMAKLDQLLEESGNGLLATVDDSGRPHMRWMTPRTLKGRPGAIYAVTTEASATADQLDRHNLVEWMFQSRSLAEVINLKGRMTLVDNPAFEAEFLEAMGSHLTVFWKINCATEHCVVLETMIEEGVYSEPMKGVRQVVRFADRSESMETANTFSAPEGR